MTIAPGLAQFFEGDVMAAKQIGELEGMVDMKYLVEKLSLSKDYIDDAIKKQKFPVYKLGTLKRFRISEVERWLRERKLNG